jgi:hypothetical protein
MKNYKDKLFDTERYTLEGILKNVDAHTAEFLEHLLEGIVERLDEGLRPRSILFNGAPPKTKKSSGDYFTLARGETEPTVRRWRREEYTKAGEWVGEGAFDWFVFRYEDWYRVENITHYYPRPRRRTKPLVK